MKHRFTVVKRAPASLSNVIANYFDLEHVAVHPRFTRVRVLSETRHAACFLVTVRMGFWRMRNVQYMEYTPPGRVVQIVNSFFGPIRGISTIEEFASGSPDVHCIITTETEIDFPIALYPLRRLVEWQFRRINTRILREDCWILERRQKLFGDYIGDYLADGHCILFKAAIRDHFAVESSALRRRTARQPTAGAATGR